MNLVGKLNRLLDDIHAIRAHLDRLFPLRGDAYEGWVGYVDDAKRAALEERQAAYTAQTGRRLPPGEEPPSLMETLGGL